MNMIDGCHWYAVKDGDPHLRWLLNRHYSARHYRDVRKPVLSAGPGKKLCLLTSDGLAGFIWRVFIDDTQPKQTGMSCSFFRNEGGYLSSVLILEAEQLAIAKWPDEERRFYTIVDQNKVASRNPGYCFKMAGWEHVANTAGGKMIFAKTA